MTAHGTISPNIGTIDLQGCSLSTFYLFIYYFIYLFGLNYENSIKLNISHK